MVFVTSLFALVVLPSWLFCDQICKDFQKRNSRLWRRWSLQMLYPTTWSWTIPTGLWVRALSAASPLPESNLNCKSSLKHLVVRVIMCEKMTHIYKWTAERPWICAASLSVRVWIMAYYIVSRDTEWDRFVPINVGVTDSCSGAHQVQIGIVGCRAYIERNSTCRLWGAFFLWNHWYVCVVSVHNVNLDTMWTWTSAVWVQKVDRPRSSKYIGLCKLRSRVDMWYLMGRVNCRAYCTSQLAGRTPALSESDCNCYSGCEFFHYSFLLYHHFTAVAFVRRFIIRF